MMNPDEVRNISTVYRRLLEGETTRDGWARFDTSMQHLTSLTDDELATEAAIAYCHHFDKNPRCQVAHPGTQCFVPSLIEAVNSILELHRKTGDLHFKNRYILECYLSFEHEGFIVID